MNPDIETTPESISRLVKVFEDNPRIGLTGPQILRPNKSVEISCCAEPKPLLALVEYSFLRDWPILNRFARSYRLNGFDHRSSRSVPIISGSCLAMRAEDFARLGGFDEKIFLYFEEFDLAKRVRDQLQQRVYFCAEAVITHIGQVSTQQLKDADSHFRESRRYWFTKAYGPGGRIAVKLLELMERRHG
jgi:GT2 family glycosyltransferase